MDEFDSLGPSQAARYLGCSRTTIYRMRREGDLPDAKAWTPEVLREAWLARPARRRPSSRRMQEQAEPGSTKPAQDDLDLNLPKGPRPARQTQVAEPVTPWAPGPVVAGPGGSIPPQAPAAPPPPTPQEAPSSSTLPADQAEEFFDW